jgi:hypothetical protein
MLYEKLNPQMQKMVDDYARRLAGLTWSRRSEILLAAAPSFAEDLPPQKAPMAARGFITAVLERLGDEPVDDPFQAGLYLTSLHAEQRQAAEAYLEAHPEVRAAVDELFGSGN